MSVRLIHEMTFEELKTNEIYPRFVYMLGEDTLVDVFVGIPQNHEINEAIGLYVSDIPEIINHIEKETKRFIFIHSEEIPTDEDIAKINELYTQNLEEVNPAIEEDKDCCKEDEEILDITNNEIESSADDYCKDAYYDWSNEDIKGEVTE